MKIYHSSKDFPRSAKRPILALGNFDGVHLAHQKMFQKARKLARQVEGIAVAYSFEPHPVKVLSKESAPLLINSLPQKLELLAAQKLDAVILEPFDSKFAQLSAQAWFDRILLKNTHAFGLVAGYDFTFGSHRSGTVETLEELCQKSGVLCQILGAQMAGETLISSSQVRNFIARGDIAPANAMLGRPFYIDGIVVQGAGRGASLGIPTANLEVENELLPLMGVYACWAEVKNRRYQAVVNIGMNPTFGGSRLSVEAHLLRFKQRIYGKKVRLYFIQRIREEKPFRSAQELIRQIQIDIQSGSKILARKKMK